MKLDRRAFLTLLAVIPGATFVKYAMPAATSLSPFTICAWIYPKDVKENGRIHTTDRIAHVAQWNRALSNSEVTLLSEGFPPSNMHSQDLRYYAPLSRPAILGEKSTDWQHVCYIHEGNYKDV